MSTKLARLKHEALESCRFRKHNMNKFERTKYGYYARCRNCGMKVYITLNPSPNDIEIGGEAIALTCKGWNTPYR